MNDSYDLDFFIDFKANLWCKGNILAHEGRLLAAILKVERGVASRGCGSQPLASGGPVPRPPGTGCEELAARIRRKCRRRKRGTRPKIATVERREARLPLLREAGTPPGAWPAASLRAYRVPLHPGRLSALRPPLDRGGK